MKYSPVHLFEWLDQRGSKLARLGQLDLFPVIRENISQAFDNLADTAMMVTERAVQTLASYETKVGQTQGHLFIYSLIRIKEHCTWNTT